MPQIMINGTKYNYLDQGRGQAPALVLLHGFTGSSASWAEITEMIGGRRRTIAIDLPGHGRTESSNQIHHYRMESVAGDIIKLLHTLNVGEMDLLGYSMGGRLALYMAIHNPTCFKSLILECASPGLDSLNARQERVDNDEKLAKFIEAEGVAAFIEHWQKLPLFASQNNLDSKKLAQQHRRRLNNSAVGLANSLRGMSTGCQPSLWPELAGFRVPTLLMAGALDEKFVAISKQMVGKITDSRIEIFPGAGHNIHFEQPGEFLKAVQKFLNQRHQLAQTEKEHK
jgi:2-succinyl-6-hydroxy-2,4-cyclohexadiene-1-carboxylate synthase